MWEQPLEREPAIREALVRVGAVREEGDILGVTVERAREAYPIYALGYCERYARAEEALRRHRNLLLLGRSGTFQYNNMDHSLEDALRLYASLSRPDAARGAG